MAPHPKPRMQDSAAVVLMRGAGPALEAYWVKRGEAVGYMPGFHAFIGGKVNGEDRALEVAGAGGEEDRLLRACALREAFEETGVLLGLDAPAEFAPLAEARRRLLAGEATFAALAGEHGWRFRADALVFAGRWTTPPFASQHFDTSFFLARVPEGQEPAILPGELECGEWIAPAEAMARWKRGEATFAAPILYTMLALADEARGDGALDDASLASLGNRLAAVPAIAAGPARRIELKWGIVLQPMKTRPLPPATHTNAYLVGEREMALIDPGSGEPAELEALFALIDSLRADGRALKLVLITHHHPDHTGGVDAVRERYRVKVAAHAETARHVRVDFTLADRDWIPLVPGTGDWNLRALHTPGHARGHLCFLHPRTRSLFTGDHIPGGSGTVIIDPPEGDMSDYVASLERLLGEPVETLFPGHGSPQGGAMRRIRWLIAHRLEREAKVIAALGPEPAALAALLERAYVDTPRELWAYAERSLLAHLIKLEREGRARREGESWRSAGG
jgi:ribonuclease/clavin/mitogillin